MASIEKRIVQIRRDVIEVTGEGITGVRYTETKHRSLQHHFTADAC